MKLVPALAKTGEPGCLPASSSHPSSVDAVGSLQDHPFGPSFRVPVVVVLPEVKTLGLVQTKSGKCCCVGVQLVR